MNKVLPILKKNWIIILCLLVPIAAIAAGWVFSSGWNASIKEKVEQSVQQDMRRLNGLTQRFEIPQLDPDAEPISFSMVPNRATIELASEKLTTNIEQSEKIFELAVQYNAEGKSLLIDGPNPEDRLFPTPDSTQSRLRKLARFRDVWQQAHVNLLEDIEAGQSPDPQRVAEIIQDFRETLRNRFVGDRVEQTLSEDELATIDRRASERRAEIYRTRAADIAFYADKDVFAGVFGPMQDDQQGRRTTRQQTPDQQRRVDLETAWEWQHRYWVHEEIMRGLKAANTEPETGFLIPVHRGAVKRVLSVDAEPWDLSATPQNMPSPTPDSSQIQRDYNASITGLTSWPEKPNQLYDVRDVTIELHADSGDLDRIIESLKAQNFIKVADMDIHEIDEMIALRNGYDYGTDHVVRLTLELQTIWLREWTKRSMPPGVRETFGIPQEEPKEQGQTS